MGCLKQEIGVHERRLLIHFINFIRNGIVNRKKKKKKGNRWVLIRQKGGALSSDLFLSFFKINYIVLMFIIKSREEPHKADI